MKRLEKLKMLLLTLVLVSFFACNKNDSSSVNPESPTISVRLVDAPGAYEAVNVEIVDVMIKMNDSGEGDEGWMSLEAESGIVNLLDFTGGFSKVLVDRFPIPAGTLSQMRLVLGDGNTIEILNDQEVAETFDLKTPSAQQSGLKVKIDALIEEGFTYNYVLDFDVQKSIVMAGNSGNIILKPVLYASAEVSSGIIEGTVGPAEALPAVASVLVDDMGDNDPENDFVISATTDENGAFALWGVPGGTYEVMIAPVNAESDYAATSIEGVVVTNGEITTMDPVELMLKPGAISGDVTNDMVVNVSVKLKETDEVVATLNSNENGEFLIEDLPAGVYIVTVGAEGYVSVEVEATVEVDAETVLEAITLVLEEA
ncbi:DUF4382 domain-containing protein [Gaetbulibacter saemankumensis]|uniref:DUF4382 domain-containing protein n=1 Tax=Gaetbulibacter saemankumensis TaxID=311208 RepID=UPI00041E1B32|nr:DUF4382 domain-containing protein [Gaetbulibacter saemankumensis]